jgi:hypothetical protein
VGVIHWANLAGGALATRWVGVIHWANLAGGALATRWVGVIRWGKPIRLAVIRSARPIR